MNLAQPGLIEPVKHGLEPNRMEQPPRLAQAAPVGFALRELSDFMRDLQAATELLGSATPHGFEP